VNDSTGNDAPFQVIDWGQTHYADAFKRQKEQVEARKNGEVPDTLVFTEHKPVFTIGLRKGANKHLIWKQGACEAHGIEVHKSNRGGDITYHGPGQIVGYPIISLQAHRDLHAYLRDLESVVINTLQTFGLESDRRAGKTGIWIGQRKICAIGVAVRSWITYHGFALNVAPNMEHFTGIIPCGITDGTVTSIELELQRRIGMPDVKSALAVEFQKVFQNTSANNG